MITTTLNRIREHRSCQPGWEKLLTGLGKTKADDEPLSFATILEINNLDDALWCCRAEPQYAKEWRLFAVAVARRVEHLNTDPRVKNVIDVAERYAHGDATDAELNAARTAAKTAEKVAGAATWSAWTAARVAAKTAWAATLATAWAAAWTAAWTAAWAATLATAPVSGNAARNAARAAEKAEREWQTQEFLRVVIETE